MFKHDHEIDEIPYLFSVVFCARLTIRGTHRGRSWPRGCGKTTCAGWIVARALTPGDSLYVAGGEIVLFAGSIEQCRITYRQALTFLEPRLDEYRLVDSATRVAITRKDCRTRLKAVGSNPKTSLGLVGVPARDTRRTGGAAYRGRGLRYGMPFAPHKARSARRSRRF